MSYPQQGGGRGYPSQGGYPPQQGGYPSQQGGYPPQQGGYPPQQGGYPPQQGGYPPQGGPPQGGPPGQGGPQQFNSGYYYNQINNQEIEKLKAAFNAVDKDRSGEISVDELAQMTWNGNIRFSRETARMLVKVFDKDRSGSIGFHEYASLFRFVQTMQQSFQQYDRDRSGSIDVNEVAQAIQSGGFQLSPQTLQIVYNRFLTDRNAKGLNLEQFIQLCAFLGSLRAAFMAFDYYRSGWAQLNLDQVFFIAAAAT